jgi:hypothetical protein
MREVPHVLDQLRRLVDGEVGAEPDQDEREPLESVALQSHGAPISAQRLYIGFTVAKLPLDLRRCSPDRGHNLKPHRHRSQRLLHILRGAASRDRPGIESDARSPRRFHPVESKRPPVLAIAVVGEEIPALMDGDELMGLDVTLRLLSVASLILEADTFVVATRLGNRDEHLGIDGHPGPHERHNGSLQRGDAASNAGRQHVLEFGERPHRSIFESFDRATGSGEQANGDGQGLVVVEKKRGNICTGVELVSPRGAADRAHLITKFTEPVDVASQRSLADIEPAHEFWPRPHSP